MSTAQTSQGPKSSRLLDQMRDLMRVRRYALWTERAYGDRVRRYVKYHGMNSREDLADGSRKVEAFLTHLAVQGKVAPATQNPALNALLFMYRHVLARGLEFVEGFARARRPLRTPVVLSKAEMERWLAAMPDTYRLFGQLLYGTGMRLREGLRLRVHPVR